MSPRSSSPVDATPAPRWSIIQAFYQRRMPRGQTISSIETGQYNPSTLLALLLARQLEKRVEDIFFLEEPS
jgi:hypothetical protein